MSDPANVYALDDIRTITGRDVQPVVATAADVEAGDPEVRGHGLAGRGDGQHRRRRRRARTRRTTSTPRVEDAPIVKLVNAIMTQAVGDRASDVHIEPTEHDCGSGSASTACCTKPMPPAPKNIQGGLISRLKVMADLNIAEKRVPQDGRISMKVGGKQLDLRVATLPTVYGEKVVIRILDKSQRAAAPRGPRVPRGRLQAVLGVVQQAVRRDPGHRADRVGQVDHAVRDAQHPEPGSTATSSRSRTRSSTGWPASTRCR